MTDHLLRKYAPIPATGWNRIDDEAKTRLTPRLAARRLVDWSGPHGWAHSATNLGRTEPVNSAPPGTKSETAVARRRRVLALSEFRVSFTVECSELQDTERGATDVDLADLERATYDAALIENRAVSMAGPRQGSPASSKPAPIPRCRWAKTSRPTRTRSRMPLIYFARQALRAPMLWPSTRMGTPGSWKRPSPGATPCSST